MRFLTLFSIFIFLWITVYLVVSYIAFSGSFTFNSPSIQEVKVDSTYAVARS